MQIKLAKYAKKYAKKSGQICSKICKLILKYMTYLPVFEGFRHKCYFHFEHFLKKNLRQLNKNLMDFLNQKLYFLQNFAPQKLQKRPKIA